MSKKWLLFALVGLLLAGCGAFFTRVGWIGTSANNRMQFRYGYFDGIEQKDVTLESADPLEVTYDVTADAGTLTLQLIAPDETAVWQESFTTDAADTTTIQLEEAGRYRFTALGADASGEFELRWQQ